MSKSALVVCIFSSLCLLISACGGGSDTSSFSGSASSFGASGNGESSFGISSEAVAKAYSGPTEPLRLTTENAYQVLQFADELFIFDIFPSFFQECDSGSVSRPGEVVAGAQLTATYDECKVVSWGTITGVSYHSFVSLAQVLEQDGEGNYTESLGTGALVDNYEVSSENLVSVNERGIRRTVVQNRNFVFNYVPGSQYEIANKEVSGDLALTETSPDGVEEFSFFEDVSSRQQGGYFAPRDVAGKLYNSVLGGGVTVQTLIPYTGSLLAMHSITQDLVPQGRVKITGLNSTIETYVEGDNQRIVLDADGDGEFESTGTFGWYGDIDWD